MVRESDPNTSPGSARGSAVPRLVSGLPRPRRGLSVRRQLWIHLCVIVKRGAHSEAILEIRRALMIARATSPRPIVITHEPFFANHSSALVRHPEGRSCQLAFSSHTE